ncbi:MAG: hypothetical protein ACOCTT_01170 [archaeon]
MDYGGYPEKSNWKKKYELAVPILLLVLVIGVLSWQMGWLNFIPGIGDSKVTNVLIVGEDDVLRHELEGISGLNLDVITMEEAEKIEHPGFLDGYDIFFLTEHMGEQPGDLPGNFRQHLATNLDEGANLILYGLAGTRVPEDPQVDGWTQHGMNKYIPVDCPGSGACSVEKKGYPGEMVSLRTISMGHYIIKDYGTEYDISDDILNFSFVNMNTRPGSSRISQIKVFEEGVYDKTPPGIVERTWGVDGRAIYFAYHPTHSSTILKNTIRYLG